MGREIDLHTHSTASDGSLSPAEVVRLAAEMGLSAVALTDHDTTAGLDEAAAMAGQVGIEFIRGIEVSCPFPRPGTMHLLGYGFDANHPAMRELTRQLGDARQERAELILGRLGALGIELSMQELRAQGSGLGRPQMASLLVSKGHAHSNNDAFRRYLGGGGAAYVQNMPLEPARVIDMIRAAGGLVSLAHPLQLRRADWTQLAAMVKELADQGMEGLETLHSSHTTETVHKLTRLADRLGLITTGGSDYHGPQRSGARPGQAGGRVIPRSFLEPLRERLADRQAVVASCAA